MDGDSRSGRKCQRGLTSTRKSKIARRELRLPTRVICVGFLNIAEFRATALLKAIIDILLLFNDMKADINEVIIGAFNAKLVEGTRPGT
jgi:hypothetical protein